MTRSNFSTRTRVRVMEMLGRDGRSSFDVMEDGLEERIGRLAFIELLEWMKSR